MLLNRKDAQRARKHSKAFAGWLLPEVETVSFADGDNEKSEGKGIFGTSFSARIGQKTEVFRGLCLLISTWCLSFILFILIYLSRFSSLRNRGMEGRGWGIPEKQGTGNRKGPRRRRSIWKGLDIQSFCAAGSYFSAKLVGAELCAGEAGGGFQNGSRSSSAKEENGLRGRQFNVWERSGGWTRGA